MPLSNSLLFFATLRHFKSMFQAQLLAEAMDGTAGKASITSNGIPFLIFASPSQMGSCGSDMIPLPYMTGTDRARDRS